jgi:RNA polymerase sigma-70 factor (ECF subfamily)
MGDAKIIPIRAARRSPTSDAPRTVDEALGMHLDALYATARFLCRELAAADDLVQDTALAAFRAWGELRDPAAARSWLLKILHRRFLNVRRSDAHRPPTHDIELDALIEDAISAEGDVGMPDPLARHHILDALCALPVAFGEVAWLVDAIEMTIAEAADVLAVPVGTAASRLHRARRLLRERLAKLQEDPR